MTATEMKKPEDPGKMTGGGQKKTLIAMLLDRSGSMASCQKETEDGFNEFIAKQVEETAKIGDECVVTLAQFDTEYEYVFPPTPLEKVGKLHLVPRGATALLDAMGKLMFEMDEYLTGADPHDFDNVLFVTMTDGYENSSKEYDWDAVEALVKKHDGWDFLFLGANQDAIKTAGQMGIKRGQTVTYDVGSTHAVMGSTASNVAAYRASGGQAQTLNYSGAQRTASMTGGKTAAEKRCTCGATFGQPHTDTCEMIQEG